MSEKVSVIVPVYNVQNYLNECLDSIVNQTYKNLEIILVDDGSTDTSGKICDEYAKADDRIKVIHKKNEGQAIARNCALDLATGIYLAFVDSDDYIKSNMIHKMVEAIKETDSDVAICGIIFKHTKHIKKEFSYVRQQTTGDRDLLLCKYMGHKVFVGMCNKIYKKELFDNIRFPAVRCREDSCILHEVLGNCSRFVELPDCFYVQNVRVDSTEGKSFNKEKIDCALKAVMRRRKYAAEYCPQYYHYVEPILVYLWYEMLQMIVEKNNANRNDDLYIEMYGYLKKEISVISEEILDFQDREKIKKISKLAQNPNLLYLELKKQKSIYKIKQKAKRMLKYISER